MTTTEHYTIAIIGGGTAGITVAARIHRANPDVDVAIVEPSEKHYYQPLWTLVGAGVVAKEVTEHDEADYIPDGATWIREAATELHPDDNYFLTDKGRRVEYDWLIVAPGIKLLWDRIKGAREALGKDGVCSNYSYQTVDSTWDALRTFKGGTAVFTYPSTAIKCGGAPQKIMWLAEHFLEKHHLRDKSKIIFASAGDKIFGVPKYRKSLEKLVEERHIETRWHHDLVEIRPDSKEAVFRLTDSGEKDVIKYDLLHVTPPMGPYEFVADSPLADASGWVEVDKYTLQHVRYPNVFSLGDSSSAPTSKTGAAVRKQAPVVVANLLSAMAGKALKAKYNGYTSCPLVTGYGRLILAEFDYDGNPVETFPFDQSKERLSMYLLKKHVLPQLYWRGMLRGRA